MQQQLPLDIITEYIELRDEIDRKCNRLWNIHQSRMNCKEGCAFCCQSFKIFPLEFYSIQQSLIKKPTQVAKKFKAESCKFLIDNTCSIYVNRPIICRTHGYPLTRLNEEAGAYEISFCELNFTDNTFEKFNRNNVYFEDKFNSKLFMLNKRFIEKLPEDNFEPIQLIELNDVEVNTGM
jgi:Fe-S-cluster containining protein